MATDLPNLDGAEFSVTYTIPPQLATFGGHAYYSEAAGTVAPVPPVVLNVSPGAGTLITAATPISLDVTDEQNSFLRILLVVTLPGIKEVAYDGLGFGPKYQGIANTQTSIVNGYRFTLLRDGGWPAAPEVTPFVIDTTGGEAA